MKKLLAGVMLGLVITIIATSTAVAGTYTGYGPPYDSNYTNSIKYPTIAQAASATWTNYQAHWGVHPPGCNDSLVSAGGTDALPNLVAIVWYSGTTCTGGTGILATAYTYSYDPGKNLGNPCNCAGDPINLATGSEYRDDEDVLLGDLSFHRYYNSHPTTASTFIGSHWRHTFDRSVVYGSENNVTTARAFRPDGREVVFKLTSGQWVADADIADRLTELTGDGGDLSGWIYLNASTREQESYDANGNLVSITAPGGLETILTYSTSSTPSSVAPAPDLLLTVTDPRGRTLNFTYNGSSQVASVTAPDGGVLTYSYDPNGNLTSVTYPDKTSRQYVYNESSQTSGADLPNALTGDIDEANTHFTSIGYNAQGQAVSSQLAGGAESTTVSYNSDGTTSVTYPTGAQTSLGFTTINGAIHATAVSAPCGVGCGQPNAAAKFDGNGYLASTTDFNGNVTKTIYDANGLLDQKIDALGAPAQRTTNFSWNTSLRVPLTRAVLDANGNTVSNTQWVYNSTGQTLARCEIDPSSSATSGYTCSNSGTVPAGVRRWTYTYCAAVDATQCPIVGLMLTATGPRTDVAQTTSYSYYLTSSAADCGTPGSACHQPGDLHTITDPSGHITTIASYDGAGRVTRITDANGINTDMTYTPRGWLASRSVDGATTGFAYTPYGAVQTTTDPDGVTTTYGYDPAHRLVKITDAQGNYIQYTLDAAGNKTAEQVYDSTGTLHKSLTRSFNTLGQLTQVMDGLNHTIFDASASNSYDANGNLVQSADGLGIQRQLGYDALNRLVQTIDNYNGTN